MIFYYLILAHLLGDFVFQPTKLVLWKRRTYVGTLTHSFIHFVISFVLLLPIISNGYFWLLYVILGINFVHFWIDEAKINYDLKHDKKVTPFLVDQLLHLFVILIAYFFIKDVKIVLPENDFFRIYTDKMTVTFFSILIFSTATIEIFRFQIKKEKNKNAKLEIKPEKILDRMIVFTIIYVILMFLSFSAID